MQKIFYILDSTKLYGKERANIQVARVLKKNGYSVKFFLNSRMETELENEFSEFYYKKIPFPRNISDKCSVFVLIKSFFCSLICLGKEIKRNRPDFVIVPTEIALLYLFPVLFFSKTKIVFRMGDTPIVDRKTGFFAYIYGFIWKYVIVNNIDINVCISNYVADRMQLSGRKKNICDRVILNVVPCREISHDDVKYKEDKNALKVGYMGRIVPDKGVLKLVEAVKSLIYRGKKIEAYIAGKSSDDNAYFQEINRVLDEGNLSAVIHFVGNVYDLEKFYSCIDILVVPSIYEEPLSNVIGEAKAHHKASIIFPKGGMPELINHLVDGYICSDTSVNALVCGLCYYEENRNSIKKHGDAAFDSLVSLGLTADVFERKWLDALK